MAVKATAQITLSSVIDVKATYRYYLLQSSTLAKPAKPSTFPPASTWGDVEPNYVDGSTSTLYFVDCTVFCDDTFNYSAVSVSSAYEAAKIAYNKALSAQNGVTTLTNRVATAETAIESNKEQISLRATKTEVEQSYAQTASRGQQLVTNGNGMLGNNTNFPSLTFDGTVSNDSPGSFTYPTLSKYIAPASSEFIPVNTAKRYTLSFDARSSNGLAQLYGFLSFYDSDKQEIFCNNHSHDASTLTTLTQELKPGDIVMHLSDVSAWQRASLRTKVMIWNYTNSFGYTYPVGTYTRNNPYLLIENSMPTEDAIDYTNNTVKLRTAWTGGTVPAGTSVSQGLDGSTYKYLVTAYNGVTPANTWKSYEGSIAGVDYSGGNVSNMFPPGVAYAKVAFLWNLNSANDQLWVTNISVQDTTETNALGSRLTEAETQILQNAQGITLRATKTEVTEAVENVKIGGRNLITMASLSGDYIDNVTISSTNDMLCEGIAEWNMAVLKYDNVLEPGEYTVNWTRHMEDSSTRKNINLISASPIQYAPGTASSESNNSFYNTRHGLPNVTYANTTPFTFSIDTTQKIYFVVPSDNSITQQRITGFKLETGNKATDWTPAPEDVDANVDVKVNSIEIGGRNLLRDSDAEVTKEAGGSNPEFIQYADLAPIFDEYGLVEYTLSFDLKSADISNASSVQVYLQNGGGARHEFPYKIIPVTTEYKRYSFTFTPALKNETETKSMLAFYGTYGTGNIPSVKNVKLEKGNKATDWSPAPEDVANDISDAQNTADDAKTRITTAESTIQLLADSIAQLVRDGNGGSLIKQDSSGMWYFNIGGLEERIAGATSDITKLEGLVVDANGEIDALASLAETLQKNTEYVRSYTDENGQPCLELGEGDSVFKVRITNTEIQFAEDTAVPAKLNRKMLVIEKAMVKNELQFGDDEEANIAGVWVWKRRANGNLGLSWKGVTS